MEKMTYEERKEIAKKIIETVRRHDLIDIEMVSPLIAMYVMDIYFQGRTDGVNMYREILETERTKHENIKPGN